MFNDKTIACKDCGTDFIFSAGEQEFFEQKGFDNEPIRCKECRDKKKADSRNRGPKTNNKSRGFNRER